MHSPKAFVVQDVPLLHAEMQRFGLAALVTLSSHGLVATHVPLLLDEARGEYGTLSGHISRANDQWQNSSPEIEALAIFVGPDAYVSPRWYPAKQETGRVVPTWNYAAIHAYGPLTFFSEVEKLRDLVTRLTAKHEAQFPDPWQPTDSPPIFIESQLKAIVGFEMPITRLEGKHKFNQNRSNADRLGVLEALKSSPIDRDQEAAAFMQDLDLDKT